jgi:hypothetical protein
MDWALAGITRAWSARSSAGSRIRVALSAFGNMLSVVQTDDAVEGSPISERRIQRERG